MFGDFDWLYKRVAQFVSDSCFLFTSLRKDSVVNYASIWKLFSPSVSGPDVLCNALNISQFNLVAPPDSQICGGNFPKRNNRPKSWCQILRLVTIEIVVKSTNDTQHFEHAVVARSPICYGESRVSGHVSITEGRRWVIQIFRIWVGR